jgi:hypothetical protein
MTRRELAYYQYKQADDLLRKIFQRMHDLNMYPDGIEDALGISHEFLLDIETGREPFLDMLTDFALELNLKITFQVEEIN